MAFEGVRGTGSCCPFRVEGDLLLFLGIEDRDEFLCSDASLFTASNLVAANGGGNGDMEMPEIDAE